MSKTIFFTGGGTAGHVVPNIPLIEHFHQHGWNVQYIGSEHGIEKDIINDVDISYHVIATGKLRRYFSWQNFIDPFKIMFGILQAWKILRKHKPEVIFSKGGFVAFPVVVAARWCGIPVVAHESDLTPGLANKLCFPFVKKICVTFAAGKKYFADSDKVVVTGTPIRESLFKGDASQAVKHCQFVAEKPCLLIIGGGSGANSINVAVREALPQLLAHYNIIHLCGKGKRDRTLSQPGYFQCEYAQDELADFYALADCVISRSGANSVYEILALKKPHIFVPLPLKSSRGDQIHNANHFAKQGVSRVINDEVLTADTLVSGIKDLFSQLPRIQQQLQACDIQSGTQAIVTTIEQQAVLQE